MKSTIIADELWLAWAWVSVLPMLGCLLFRYCTEEVFKTEEIKSYRTDLLFRILLLPGMFYYLADSFLLLADYQNFNWCSFSFIFHHTVTLAGAKSTLTLPYYPWFLMAPFTFHTFLLIYPDITDLNYIYLLTILICFKHLLEDPWISIKSYSWALKVSACLACGPLVFLWWNSCSNAIPVFS